MIRLAPLVLALACTNTRSAPPPPPPPPPVVPVPPPAEVPSLAGAEAIGFLPDDTDAVAVASSLDAVASTLSDAPLFEALTGLAPAGLSRTQPVGIAFLPGHEGTSAGWIAFAYVADAKAFEASVPAARRARRGELAFIADTATMLRQLLPPVGTKHRGPDLASAPAFRADIAKLHLGALLSWWTPYRGTAGISVAGATLRLGAVDGVPDSLGGDRMQELQIAHLAEALVDGDDVPAALTAKRDAATKDLERLDKELDTARQLVVDGVAKQLGVPTTRRKLIEQTFVAPAPTVKAWLAPFVERWRAPALQAQLDAARNQVAALDRQVHGAENAAAARRPVPARTPGADLSPVISDVHEPGLGGSSRGHR